MLSTFDVRCEYKGVGWVKKSRISFMTKSLWRKLIWFSLAVATIFAFQNCGRPFRSSSLLIPHADDQGVQSESESEIATETETNETPTGSSANSVPPSNSPAWLFSRDGSSYAPIAGLRDGEVLVTDRNYGEPFFDYDGDGLIDSIKILTQTATKICGNGNRAESHTIQVFSGDPARKLLFQSGAIEDTCVSPNGGTTVPYRAMGVGQVHIGPNAFELAVSPQYYSNGWFVNKSTNFFYTALTTSYDAYLAAQVLPTGLKHANWTQPYNGLLISIDGATKYVAATSGRFHRFSFAPYSQSQLEVDVPFVARADIAGRNYGALTHDVEGNTSKVFLVAGEPAYELYANFMSSYGKATVEPLDLWGSIERHVSVFDMAKPSVAQKFYSYAHDDNDGHTFRNRVSFPSISVLPAKGSGGSKLIYNVFDGHTWSIHLGAGGGAESQAVLANHFVWDVIRRSKDEFDIITSPVDLTNKVFVPDYVSSSGTPGSWRKENYFPALETRIYTWTRASEMFAIKKRIEGLIPKMSSGVRPTPYTANHTGRHWRVEIGYIDDSGRTVMRMVDAKKSSTEVDYPL